MADGKVKKALKDLSLPVKPSATKAALMVADMVKKAPAGGADAVRKQLGAKVEEKGAVWEGGVVKCLVGVAGDAKEKPMIEAVSMCLYHVLADCPDNVAIAVASGAPKVLMDLCKDKSLLVQLHAAASACELASHGGTEARQAMLAAGGLKNLTAVAAALDTEDVIAKQGINKAIAYEAGARQRAAATALRLLSVEEGAKKSAGEVGVLKQLVILIGGSQDVKAQEEGAHALFLLMGDARNRPLLLACGGLPPLAKLLESPSEHAKTMAAGAFKEVSRDVALRADVRKAGAISPLVQICFEATAASAHVEAAGALLELANELECKVILKDIGATKDLASLLKSSHAHVQENALAVLAFMCAFGKENIKQAEVRLSLTSCTDLQDDVCECGAVGDIVALARSGGKTVHNQALCSLAAVCLRHPPNAAQAAAASGVEAVVRHLTSVDATVQANAIHALLSLAGSYEPNRREAARLGAPATLLVLTGVHAPPPLRVLATEALAALWVMPARNATNASLSLARITAPGGGLAQPYVKQQCEKVVEDVDELLNEIKGCRDSVGDFVAEDQGKHAALLLRLAWHDAGTVQIKSVKEVSAANGGANGSLHFEEELQRPENKGLDEGIKLLQPFKKRFPRVSWADLIQMAAASAIEQVGGPRIITLYGRQDADQAFTQEGVHVPVIDQAMLGEGGGAPEEEEQAEEPQEGEAPPIKKGKLEKALERLGLSTRQMAAVCGSTVVGWHKVEALAHAGKWDVSYFTHVLEDVKARLKKKADDAEDDAEPPPLAPDRAMVMSDRFLEIVKSYAEDHSGATFGDDYMEVHKIMSEAGAVFDPRAPEGFFLGVSSTVPAAMT